MSFYHLIRDWLLDPLSLLFFVLLAVLLYSVLRPHTRWLRFMLISSVSLLMFVSSPSIVNRMVLQLEMVYPSAQRCEAPSAIVLLAGGVDSKARLPTQFELMSRASLGRATAAWRVSEQYTDIPIVVSGGVLKRVAEADVLSNYLLALGVEPQRILKETGSRTTFENAINVERLLSGMKIQTPVLLVTSALHMPRSVATLSKLGLDSCAYPVQRIGIVDAPWFALIPQTTALVKFDALLHEWVALLYYRLSDKV